jgi:hypothetical protein
MCGAGSLGRHGVILAVFRRVHCMLLRILRRALDRCAPFWTTRKWSLSFVWSTVRSCIALGDVHGMTPSVARQQGQELSKARFVLQSSCSFQDFTVDHL